MHTHGFDLLVRFRRQAGQLTHALKPPAVVSAALAHHADCSLQDIIELHYWDVPGGLRVIGQADFLFAKRESKLFETYGTKMNLQLGAAAGR